MKMITMLLLSLTVLSSTAYARQYIQCGTSNSWDRMVVNLDGDDSTLFMTTGVHDPNELRILKDLLFVEMDETYHYFKTTGEIEELVLVKNEDFGQALSYLEVIITHTNTLSGESETKTMGCFSSVHND